MMTETKKVHWPPQQQKPPGYKYAFSAAEAKEKDPPTFCWTCQRAEKVLDSKGFLEATTAYTVPLLHWEVGWKEEEEGVGNGQVMEWNRWSGWVLPKRGSGSNSRFISSSSGMYQVWGFEPTISTLHFLPSIFGNSVHSPFIHSPSLSSFPSSRQRLLIDGEKKNVAPKICIPLLPRSSKSLRLTVPPQKMCKISADRKS